MAQLWYLMWLASQLFEYPLQMLDRYVAVHASPDKHQGFSFEKEILFSQIYTYLLALSPMNLLSLQCL